MLNQLRLLFKGANTELMRMCVLGLLTGILSAIVIILFRLLIEICQFYLLPEGNHENYEALPTYWLFFLPLIGAIVLAIMYHFIPEENRAVGVVHTLDRMQYHQSKLPFMNTLVQFFGAAISIICGHSVGREGPSIHFGASSGGLLANFLNLSSHTRRVLLSAGAAAAIAASFNTPLAGVIFALEVIMLEYTVLSMTPIIISAVIATLISHAVFGNHSTLIAPNVGVLANTEMLAVVVAGILIGLVAAAFNRTLVSITLFSKQFQLEKRIVLAGVITGLLAMISPEIMSIGYDTVNLSFQNQIALTSLALIIFVKFLATTIGLGLGLPGGLIGPSLFIGALLGGAFGQAMEFLYPNLVSQPELYAMIGMGAMMGATLQAPLAALMAIFELTVNPHLILPGIIAIVAASLTSSELLKQPSIFFALMRARESDEAKDPTSFSQQNMHAVNIMDHNFVILPKVCPLNHLIDAINRNAHWIIVMSDDKILHLIPCNEFDVTAWDKQDYVDLSKVTPSFTKISEIDKQATLIQVVRLFKKDKIDAVFVRDSDIENTHGILGVLSKDELSSYVTRKIR